MSTTAPSEDQQDVRSRPGAPRPQTSPASAFLLVLASTVFSLLLCEIGLRLFTAYGASDARFTAVAGKADKPFDAGDAMRYVWRLPAAPGTDRRWFLEDPLPLPNRSQVSPQRLERYQDFERRGIFTFQADYLWNRYFVESQRCAPNSFFESYPGTALAFDPPTQSLHPRYRFPPNTTMSSGLATNEFGLRGPPLMLAKPPKTIRIAFLGASTTVGFHYFPFSYPERVASWLNRFAAANHFGVRFEALNGGREGLNSEDIAAIVRDEMLPLDPDLAVYYEGSNQFFSANELLSPRIPARKELLPRDLAAEHRVPEWIRTHLAIGELLDRSISGFGTLVEPPKPSYRLNWPAAVDELKPAVDSPDLPLRLPTIVKDLDSIRASMASIGGQLVLCSFEWLARDGMRLSPIRHQFIHKHLNTSLWPLRYADIRRLADFQNRTFRRYALDRRIPFVDVASALPQDPDLFSDAIHLTDTGERVKAWIVFQQLLPILLRQIESGQLPRPAGHPLPAPPSLAASEMPVHCGGSPSGPLERIPGGLSLDNIDLVFDEASLEYGHPVKIVTAGQQWTYAAAIPINAPAGLARPCYLFLRARVVDGQIGVGVMDLGANTFQVEKALSPSPGMMDTYVPVLFPERAVTMMIRNIAPDGVRSRLLIEDAALLAFLKPLPEETLKSIALEGVRLGGHAAALVRQKEGLLVTTAPGQGAYAGRVPLGLNGDAPAGLRVHVWMRVLGGRVGVGILTADAKAFLIERSVKPSPGTVELILPLPSPPVTGDLIIRNVAVNKVVSKALVERIEVRKAP
jgi:hypothetical protein